MGGRLKKMRTYQGVLPMFAGGAVEICNLIELR
jgi:hypothetical protein